MNCSSKSLFRLGLATVCLLQAGCTIRYTSEFMYTMITTFDQAAVASYNGVSFFPKPVPLKVGIVNPDTSALELEKSGVPNLFEVLDDKLYFDSPADKTRMLVHAARSNVMYLYRSMVTSKMFTDVEMLAALPGSLNRVAPEDESSFDLIIRVSHDQPVIGDVRGWAWQRYEVSLPGGGNNPGLSKKIAFDVHTEEDPMSQLERIRGELVEFHRASTSGGF